MGFNGVKRQVLECLSNGNVLHQERQEIDVKNRLAVGQITLDEVASVIGRAKGSDHSVSPHHQVKDIAVHIVKTWHGGQRWYIKWYFVEPNSVFISVHH